MGFRGEALASIAAVSQMELKTRRPDDELGTLLVVEGSEVKRQEPVSCEAGTNVCVKNLFFNIPARRNFLKSNAVEMRNVTEEFQRLALAHPSLAFSLVQGDEPVFELPGAKLSHRIVNLFGKAYQQQLTPVSEEAQTVKITGYVGKPASARKTRGEQFLYVNRRFVRNNYLNFAVMQAFHGLIPENSFPFYVLMIDIDPKHIDVNVHPTKTEVKFDDERVVYAVVHAAIKQALGAHHLSPAIDFQADVNIIHKLSSQNLSKEEYFNEQFGTINRSNLQNWEKLFEGDEKPESRLFSSAARPVEVLPYEEARTESAIASATAPPVPIEQTAFQLHQRYLVRGVKNGLMIIDQQLAHERILYDQYMMAFRSTPGASQQSLFPQTVSFSPADFTLVMEMEQEIKAMGFRFEIFGKNTILVSGLPARIAGGEKEIFEGLVEQFKRNQAELQLPLKESLALALARKSCVSAGQKLQPEEIQAITAGLFSCVNPNYSPAGKPTFFILDTSKIESFFK
jgi:DNA mismatch repair protein MutL